MQPFPPAVPERTWVLEELLTARCWAEERGTGSSHAGKKRVRRIRRVG